MSIPRSPNNTGMCLALIGATAAVLVVSWLLANVVIEVYELNKTLKGVLWP